MDFGDFDFDSSYLGSGNCLFFVLNIWELLETVLVKFVGQAEAGNLLFHDGLINRTPSSVDRTATKQDRIFRPCPINQTEA